MVFAMMVPSTLPVYRRVAFDSVWRLRHRHGMTFISAYLALWIVVGVALAWLGPVAERVPLQIFSSTSGVTRWPLMIVAGLHALPARSRALRRCHRSVSLSPIGLRSVAAHIRYGLTHARDCIGACGHVMAFMLLARPSFTLMFTLSGITTVERVARNPKTYFGAAVIAVTAVL
jgi:predicted metal-binding membrane protein